MASITIDGLDEEVFRRNIEAMLRVGEADRAAVKLRALLEPYAGEGKILPGRFLEVTQADYEFIGWEKLADSLARNDSPRYPISALTIAVSDAEAMGTEPAGDEDAGPLIATSHFTDEAYMFSHCAISDLLDGYSFYGCEWHGSSTHMDTALSLGGVDDLYRAVRQIEADLIATRQPPLDMIRAGSLAACYLAVLLHLAVRDTIHARGLPRALCVMAGAEGIYPYFDAPVIGKVECVELGLVTKDGKVAVAAEGERERMLELAGAVHAEGGVAAEFGRLDAFAVRKPEKKMVLELAEADMVSAAQMLDRAGEERMSGEVAEAGGRTAAQDLLAQRGPSQPLFVPGFAPEFVLAEPSAATSGPAEPVPVDPFARAGSFPELAEALPHMAASDESAEPAAPAPFEPVRVKPSHSLRARLSDPPAPAPPKPSVLGAGWAWVLRVLHSIFG